MNESTRLVAHGRGMGPRGVATLLVCWVLGAHPSLAAVTLQDGGASLAVQGRLPPISSPRLDDLEQAVQHQLLEARATFETLFARPDNDAATLADAYGLLGQHYHAYDLGETALGCYERAALHGPRDARWPYLMADLARRRGDLEQAATHYQTCLALAPEDIPALVQLGETQWELHQLEHAESLLGRALAADPACHKARALLGQIALSRGQHERAIACFEAVLAEVPAADRLHYPLAMAYRAAGDLEKARQHLAVVGESGVGLVDPLMSAVQALATGERVQLLRGRLAFSAGDYGGAATAFERAVAADPQSSRARINLATALGQLGQLRAAIAQCRLALELEPANLTAQFNLGTMLSMAGDDAEAEARLLIVLAADPDDGSAHRELAHVLRRSDRPEVALLHYDEAIRLSPGDEGARLAQAALLVSVGRYAEALWWLEEGHAVLPGAGQLAAALAKILAASPRADLRDGARALDLALRVHTATGQAGHAELVALALAELDRCDDAAQWLEEAAVAAETAGDLVSSERLLAEAARYASGDPCAVQASPGANR